MKIDVKITGLERLRRRWNSAPDKVKKMTQDALNKSGYLVEGASKRITPVDTGRLRSSISLSSTLALRAEPHVVVSPHTNYAIYVHEGTRRMKGRPFMTKGYESVKSRIRNEMRKLLKDVTKELKFN
jgi:HK97 gp10 family phage protein